MGRMSMGQKGKSFQILYGKLNFPYQLSTITVGFHRAPELFGQQSKQVLLAQSCLFDSWVPREYVPLVEFHTTDTILDCPTSDYGSMVSFRCPCTYELWIRL